MAHFSGLKTVRDPLRPCKSAASIVTLAYALQSLLEDCIIVLILVKYYEDGQAKDGLGATRSTHAIRSAYKLLLGKHGTVM
jgi:hypothetical protein